VSDRARIALRPDQALHFAVDRYAPSHAGTSLPSPTSAEAFVRALSERGLTARALDDQTGQLRYIAPPFLVRLGEVAWGIVIENGRRTLRMLDDRGEPVRVRHADVLVTGTDIVELTPGFEPRNGLWRNVARAIIHQKTLLALILAATGSAQLLAIAPPILVRQLLDNAIPDGASSTALLVLVSIAVIALYRSWIGFWRERLIIVFDSRLEVSLGSPFLKHVLSLPIRFLSGRGVGDLMQSVNGLYVARDIAVGRLAALVFDGGTAAIYAALLFVWMPGAAAIIVFGSVGIITVALLAAPGQARLQRDAVQASARQRSFLVECLGAIASVKAAAGDESVYGRSMELLRVSIVADLKRKRLDAGIDIAFEGVRSSSLAAIVILGGANAFLGQTTIGTLMAALQIGTGLLVALQNMVSAYVGFIVAQPQLARAREVLEQQSTTSGRRDRSIAPSPDVRLRDVWFRYDEQSPWVLTGYDLAVAPGERRRIEAPSGFGKTTILRLVAGMYDAIDGEIRVGGASPAHSRDAILYIPQDFQLFSGTLLENLVMFSENAPLERILTCAEQTGLDTWVRQLPMRYETVVTAGARTLSGGQRQLIAITAAAASDRGLLLLDEPMVNLDRPSQMRIVTSDALKGRTIIYAAHAGTVDL